MSRKALNPGSLMSGVGSPKVLPPGRRARAAPPDPMRLLLPEPKKVQAIAGVHPDDDDGGAACAVPGLANNAAAGAARMSPAPPMVAAVALNECAFFCAFVP